MAMLTKASYVLRRLPAWSGALAASRPCVVGKAWGALPLIPRRGYSAGGTRKAPGVHGLYINYIDHFRPHLFARPSSMSTLKIDAMLDFLTADNETFVCWIEDHSNGLLLCGLGNFKLCVCNPATRRWTHIPPLSRRWEDGVYLVFDPALSPHYDVFVIPAVPEPEKPINRANGKGSLLESEWPPTSWTLTVFSSRTGQWEERAFARLGESAGTVGDMLRAPAKASGYGPRHRYAVYHQGSLYVHCRGFFVLRLSLSEGTYQVIRTPEYGENKIHGKPYLGRSEKGVYFGIIEKSQLRVWILSELSEQRMEWILKHQHDLAQCSLHVGKYESQMDAPWMVHDVSDSDPYYEAAHVAAKTLPKERFDWDSDNDDFFTVKFDADEYPNYFSILGFHPYKEVVFLDGTFSVVAYHLKNSKAQYLGNSRPKSYYHNHTNGIYESFVYSPCMVGELNEGDNKHSSS